MKEDLVEEQTPAALDDREAIASERVRECDPGRDVMCVGDALAVVAHAQVEREVRGRPPLVLDVGADGDIRRVDEARAKELDPFVAAPSRVDEVDREASVGSIEGGVVKVAAHLQDARSEQARHEVQTRETELGLHAAAIDLVEVVVEQAVHRQTGGIRPCASARDIEPTQRDRCLPVRVRAGGQPIRHRNVPATASELRGRRCGMERVDAEVGRLDREERDRGGCRVAFTELDVQLGEAIESLQDLLVDRPWRGVVDTRPDEAIREALRDPGSALGERIADLDARRNRVEPLDCPVAPSEARPDVADVDVPVIVARPCPDVGDRSGDAPELCRVRDREDFDRLYHLERQLDGKFARHRVCRGGAVHEQRALTRSGAVEADSTPGIPHHTRQLREYIVEAVRRERKDAEQIGSEFFLHARRGGTHRPDDLQSLGDRRDLQVQIERDQLCIGHVQGGVCEDVVSVQGRHDDEGAWDDRVEREVTGRVGRRLGPRSAPRRWRHHRSSASRRPTHRAGDGRPDRRRVLVHRQAAAVERPPRSRGCSGRPARR